MTTIKAFTDLEQSKKLAEILPIESADMHHKVDRFNNDCRTLNIPYSELGFFKNADDEYCVPCWSLSALIEFLPNIIVIDGCKWELSIRKDSISYLGSMTWDGQLHISVQSDNLVDSCYEMIIKLNEQNLLVK